MEMFEAPSKSMFPTNRYSLKTYVAEFHEKSAEERLEEFLTKEMPVFLAMRDYNDDFTICHEDRYFLGISEWSEYDVIEEVEKIVSKHFTDNFEVTWEKFGNEPDDKFVTITFKWNLYWNEV